MQIEPSFLYSKAQEFYVNGLAASTLSTYSAGQIRFTNFCRQLKVTPVPSTEDTLILFATYLATINISHTTIKVYLAAVRHMHVSAGLFSFFDKQLTPRLQLTLKGIQKKQGITKPPRIRLPITLQIMGSLKTLLAKQPGSYFNIMIWAACCLAFFGFLRVGEFTVPADNQYDDSCHLSFSSISIDSRVNPQQLKVMIKQSKTDPFRKGVSIFLGATGKNLGAFSPISPSEAITQGHCLFLRMAGVLPVSDLARLLMVYSINSKWIRSAIILIVFVLARPPLLDKQIFLIQSLRCWAGGKAMPTSLILRLHHRNCPSYRNI